MTTVGERIRVRRSQLGWTQDQLATKAGISKGFLSDLERNLRNVSAEFLLKLAQALGVSTDFLMKGEEAVPAQRTEVKVPRSLAEFAEQARLSFQETLTLLEMRSQIKAHRGSSQSEDLEKFDWRKFYEAVKQFMR